MTQKLITMALAILVLVLVFYSGRMAGVASGKSEATIEYNQKIDEYKTALANQTAMLNKALNIESINLTNEVKGLLQDTQAIKQQLKNQPQPLVLINQGECIASDATLEARRKMIERVNK